jgi:hypothetical protein
MQWPEAGCVVLEDDDSYCWTPWIHSVFHGLNRVYPLLLSGCRNDSERW